MSELQSMPPGNIQALEGVQGLIKSGTAYTTAMRVARPRAPRLNAIKEACLAEAELLGKGGFYVWDVQTKDGPKVVHGPSIGMMLVCARNWGDCAVDVEVQEHGRTFVFVASFVDLETGYNLRRAHRQRKSQNIGSGYEAERAEDMIFQIGQSKAIRNVIRNALPRWLTEAAENAAADAAYSDVNKVGVAESAKRGIKAFREDFGVTVEQLVAKIGRPVDDWTARDIVSLQTAMAALHGGEATVDQIFPTNDPGKASKGGVEGLKDALADAEPETPPPAEQTQDPPPATDGYITVDGYPVPESAVKRDAETDSPATKAQLQKLAIAMKPLDAAHRDLIRQQYDVKSRRDLSKAQASELLDWFKHFHPECVEACRETERDRRTAKKAKPKAKPKPADEPPAEAADGESNPLF